MCTDSGRCPMVHPPQSLAASSQLLSQSAPTGEGDGEARSFQPSGVWSPATAEGTRGFQQFPLASSGGFSTQRNAKVQAGKAVEDPSSSLQSSRALICTGVEHPPSPAASRAVTITQHLPGSGLFSPYSFMKTLFYSLLICTFSSF